MKKARTQDHGVLTRSIKIVVQALDIISILEQSLAKANVEVQLGNHVFINWKCSGYRTFFDQACHNWFERVLRREFTSVRLIEYRFPNETRLTSCMVIADGNELRVRNYF